MDALIALDSMFERDSVAELKVECARLIALLEANGIQWRMQQPERSSPASTPEPSRLSTDEKVAFRNKIGLFSEQSLAFCRRCQSLLINANQVIE